MAKLFALEEADVLDPEVELESSAEVGEAAEAQIEVEADVAEIEDTSDAIQEGVEAADQLEEVQEVVEQAADEGGLDPVAAEAVRIAVEAICARVGANPKSVYALYATENFQSASSRKANTKIALEGIGEFLKNLWEKIKAALTKIWDKVVDFWNKHISNLGRIKKALESLKEKIGKTKGAPEPGLVTVPASLQSIFPVKATLGLEELSQFAERVSAARESYKNLFEKLERTTTDAEFNTLLANLKTIITGDKKIEFGGENTPMPSGKYDSWTLKIESEDDDGVTIYTLDIDEDHGDYADGRKDAQLDIPSKDKLKELVNATLKKVKDYIKEKDKADKRAKQVHENLKKITKEIERLNETVYEKDATTGQYKVDNTGKKIIDQNATNANKANAMLIKNGLRAYYLILSKSPAIEAKLVSYEMAYYRGIVQYVSTCLKHYKSV